MAKEDYILKQTGEQVQKAIDDALALAPATVETPGLMSASDKTKLNSLPTGASLESSLDGKVDKVPGKGLSTNDYDNSEKSKVASASQDVTDIKAKIPSQATAQNQLADKDFVNSSIATATADFKGTYDSLSELQAVTADNNDYGYVVSTDQSGNTVYSRYKYNGSAWVFEYDLNNSSFTAAEWASIQSQITAALVQKLSALPTNQELGQSLSGKQDIIPDLSTIRSGANAGATAYQKPASGIPASDIASGVIPEDVVKYASQTLTDSQKTQARTNIGAASEEELDAISRGEYVEAWDGVSEPVVADIPSGVQVEYNSQTYTGTLAASNDTLGKIYLVGTGTTDEYNRYRTSRSGVEGSYIYSWVPFGSTQMHLSDYATNADVSQLEADVSEEINLGAWRQTSMLPPAGGKIDDYASNTRICMNTQGGVQKDGTYTIICNPGYLALLYVVGKASTADWTTKRTISLNAGDIFRIAIKTDPETDFSGYTQEQIDATVIDSGVKMLGGPIVYSLQESVEDIERKDLGDFFKFSTNLYNKDDADCVDNKFVQYGNGQLANSTTLKASGWIPVIPGKKYICNYGGQSAFYDKNKTFIIGVTASNTAFVAPAGAAYVRCSFRMDSEPSNRLNQSATLLSYEPYYRIVNPGSVDVESIEKEMDKYVQTKGAVPVPFTITMGKGIYNTGAESSIVGLFVSSFIPVTPGEVILWTGKTVQSAGFNSIWGYDSNQTGGKFLVANTDEFKNRERLAIPVGISYIRVSFSLNQYFAIERPIVDEYVTPKSGKNKFDKDGLLNGNYISTNGIQGNDATTMALSGLLPIKPSTSYHFSDAQDNAPGNNASLHQFLDKGRSIISTISADTKDFTSPADAAYFRASVLQSAEDVQLEEGNARTEYEAFNKIGGYLPNMSTRTRFGSFRNTGTLANGSVLTLPKSHIVKNILLSGSIEGTIDANGVEVGVGYIPDGVTKDYDARWLLITNTTVQLYWNRNTGDLPINPLLNHGLTLTSLTHFSVEVTVTKDAYTASFRLANDLGDVYTVNIMNYVATGWGVGMPFVKNLCASSVNASLSFAPRDITKRVWCFGDSYFSFLNNSRWPYYAKADGNIGWFSNNQGGLTPESAYGDLVNMLSLGYTPTYLLWCLGMNGDTPETQVDGQYVINDYQKEWIDKVVALCEKKQIIPVLGVVPTVPTRQKTGFGNYVKSLGVRYVDFAKAVGATSAGVWNTGLLSSDGVHPSETGGKVLYSQVLVDFPEISINE